MAERPSEYHRIWYRKRSGGERERIIPPRGPLQRDLSLEAFGDVGTMVNQGYTFMEIANLTEIDATIIKDIWNNDDYPVTAEQHEAIHLAFMLNLRPVAVVSPAMRREYSTPKSRRESMLKLIRARMEGTD